MDLSYFNLLSHIYVWIYENSVNEIKRFLFIYLFIYFLFFYFFHYLIFFFAFLMAAACKVYLA